VEGFGKDEEEGRGRKGAVGRVKRTGQILPHLRGRRFQPALPPSHSPSLPPSLPPLPSDELLTGMNQVLDNMYDVLSAYRQQQVGLGGGGREGGREEGREGGGGGSDGRREWCVASSVVV